ncbi:hypothetical protein HCU66_23635 [Pseudomonas frederiksbergensis]|uniref:hypothetical protein n=1 Tax=Pseudomonas frederiksbergensis TaxID=104087 RepID=UPI00197D5B7C|nr:hypothetical protein [Pseudomonas frederiksbergensis]MBN3865208.1 hypothetical protein [Pseudomonas frederiksbergensis]
MEKVSLNRQQLEELVSSNVSFFGLDISRFSMVFLAQTIQMNVKRVINIHQMMDEIRHLEGLGAKTQTKKATVFNKEPLKGLMKTHFTDASFILKNIGIHMGLDNGGGKKLDKLIQEAFDKNTSGVVDDEFISHISTGITFGALKERARKQKLTGEWIVFQEHEEKNYYLTLAAHNEGDSLIYKRVCDCYELDYPFLRKSA